MIKMKTNKQTVNIDLWFPQNSNMFIFSETKCPLQTATNAKVILHQVF